MKEKIKNYLGEFLVIIGTGIFAYNFFNFKYNAVGLRSFLPSFAPEQPNVVIVYHYEGFAIIMLVISLMLIVAGILIVRNKPK